MGEARVSASNPVPVLDPGKGKTKTGYFWAMARDQRGWGGADPPGVVYHYAPGRAGSYAAEFLEGFEGTLQGEEEPWRSRVSPTNGYSGYNALGRKSRRGGRPLRLARCWSHARRKLMEVYKKDRSPIAEEGLRRIAEIYAIEKEVRGLDPEERLSARKERAAPLVEDFGRWLRAQRARISKKSRLGEKLSYIANHWPELIRFLEDGRIETDTNSVENRIRPLVLTRKNALFAGHDEGGQSWARIASLIETAKMNGIEPFAYLTATLEAIAAGHPSSRLGELLPWNFEEKATPTE